MYPTRRELELEFTSYYKKYVHWLAVNNPVHHAVYWVCTVITLSLTTG